MEGIIQKRIEWIEKRTPLSDMAKHYIAFQMQLYAEYYHEQQVKSVDLADVVVPKGKLCDHSFKHLKFVRDRQIVCKCGERFSY